MCGKDELRHYNKILTGVMGFQSLALLSLAFYILADSNLTYGLPQLWWSAAGGLIFISLVLIPTAYAGYNMLTFKDDNKYFYLLNMVALVFLVILIMPIGTKIRFSPYTQIDYKLKKDCLLFMNYMKDGDNFTDCNSYLQEEVYLSIYTMWGDRAKKAENSMSYRQYVSNLEESLGCCGYGPVAQCRPDRPIVHDSVKPAQMCGNKTGFYPETPFCSIKFEKSNVVAGCPYDLPTGECAVHAPQKNLTSGCAQKLQEQLESSMTVVGNIAFMLGYIQVAALIVNACLLFKRKDSDIVPPRKKMELIKWTKEDKEEAAAAKALEESSFIGRNDHVDAIASV